MRSLTEAARALHIEYLIWEAMDALLVSRKAGTEPLDPDAFDVIELTEADFFTEEERKAA